MAAEEKGVAGDHHRRGEDELSIRKHLTARAKVLAILSSTVMLDGVFLGV